MGKKFIEKIKNTFHPNRITASGLLLNVTSMALMSNPDTAPYGLGLLSTSYLADGLDGYLARRWNKKTRVGAKLDPLVDKGKFLIAMGVAATREIVAGNYLFPASFLANVVVDGISQKQRGDLVKQVEEAYDGVVYPEKCAEDTDIRSSTRANGFGKIKTGIQTASTLTYWGYYVAKNYVGEIDWCERNLNYVLAGALVTSAVLGTIGIVKRIRNKKSRLEEVVDPKA